MLVPRTPTSRRAPRRLSIALAAAIAACAGPGVHVDDVLVTSEAGAVTDSDADLTPLQRLDAAANAARARADREGATARELVDAAHALFLAADARVQRAVIAEFEARDAGAPPTIAWVLDAEDRVAESVRAEVEALTRAGLAYATRSVSVGVATNDEALPVEMSPVESGQADARSAEALQAKALQAKALNTCLLAWSVGTRRALFEGLGGACDDATAATLAADEALDDAAPLRLRGRFLSRAPWPVGDRAEGVRLLRRAVELAPVRLNQLFLGDALWQSGDEAGARAAWRRAADAEANGEALDAWHGELARRRIAAIGPR